MKQYLANLLPRLKIYGEKLDKIEGFVDKTWSFYDLDNKFYTYRFLRNKTLLISASGDVQEWKWEYLKPDSLYIKRGADGKMFRHGFVLDGLLFLQKEGNTDHPAIFYNEAIITDGDVAGYLLRIFKAKKNIKSITTDFFYSDVNNTGLTIGSELYDVNYEPVDGGRFNFDDRKVVVHDGIVTEIFYEQNYFTDKGEILVQAKYFDRISYGDRVFLVNSGSNGSTLDLAEGKFKLFKPLNGTGSIVVNSGQVVKLTEQSIMKIIVLIITFILIIAFSYLLISSSNWLHR